MDAISYRCNKSNKIIFANIVMFFLLCSMVYAQTPTPTAHIPSVIIEDVVLQNVNTHVLHFQLIDTGTTAYDFNIGEFQFHLTVQTYSVELFFFNINIVAVFIGGMFAGLLAKVIMS